MWLQNLPLCSLLAQKHTKLHLKCCQPITVSVIVINTTLTLWPDTPKAFLSWNCLLYHFSSFLLICLLTSQLNVRCWARIQSEASSGNFYFTYFWLHIELQTTHSLATHHYAKCTSSLTRNLRQLGSGKDWGEQKGSYANLI